MRPRIGLKRLSASSFTCLCALPANHKLVDPLDERRGGKVSAELRENHHLCDSSIGRLYDRNEEVLAFAVVDHHLISLHAAPTSQTGSLHQASAGKQTQDPSVRCPRWNARVRYCRRAVPHVCRKAMDHANNCSGGGSYSRTAPLGDSDFSRIMRHARDRYCRDLSSRQTRFSSLSAPKLVRSAIALSVNYRETFC
jgi:hypothetical protein